MCPLYPFDHLRTTKSGCTLIIMHVTIKKILPVDVHGNHLKFMHQGLRHVPILMLTIRARHFSYITLTLFRVIPLKAPVCLPLYTARHIIFF